MSDSSATVLVEELEEDDLGVMAADEGLLNSTTYRIKTARFVPPLWVPALLVAASSVTTVAVDQPTSFNYDFGAAATQQNGTEFSLSRGRLISLGEARLIAIESLLRAEKKRASAAEAEAAFYETVLIDEA